MLFYILKRILIFLPTLLIISFIAFGLSKCTPGDPVEILNDTEGEFSTISATDAAYAERSYLATAQRLHLDKPTFYFSFTSAAFPDTLYKYIHKDQRKTLKNLIAHYGDWPKIEKYYLQVHRLDQQLFAVPDTIAPNAFRKIRASVKQLYVNDKKDKIENHLSIIKNKIDENILLRKYLKKETDQLIADYNSIIHHSSSIKKWIPSFQWYGFDNQYHHWFSHFLVGDFGISYDDNRPVANKMKDALRYTLMVNVAALLLAFLIALPIGVIAAAKRDSRFDKWSSLILFLLYALPSFWLATLLLVFFTTPEYGMKIFAGIGVGNLPTDAPFWKRFIETADHLFLPVLCTSYTALAFISRQMRGSVLNVIKKDYIRTAQAKGLPPNKVIWKHAFRNALFPIITMIAGIFPSMLAGSVIIEVIFNIPGMGRLAFNAIMLKDWPVVFTVLMFGAILTMIGILIADLLYAKADPRVVIG